AVHGGWSSWSSWGTCSADCQRHQLRYCINPTPQYGGRVCAGEHMLSQDCTGDMCTPIHGGWSSWSSWGNCSSDCQHHRLRSCNNPTPQHGGTNCTGEHTQSQDCTGGICTPIHGGWSSWSSWGPCFSDCEHHRLRSCTNPTPQHGGTNCTGDDTLSQECTGDLCTPIHGGWSSWSSWGVCSSDCRHHRSRSCNNPTPQHGGTNCTGDNTLSQDCTGGMCT
ncbi:unnamed protein product, partial [Meganyctiphanes norvegica]